LDSTTSQRVGSLGLGPSNGVTKNEKAETAEKAVRLFEVFEVFEEQNCRFCRFRLFVFQTLFRQRNVHL
jgi:hypothetical protein